MTKIRLKPIKTWTFSPTSLPPPLSSSHLPLLPCSTPSSPLLPLSFLLLCSASPPPLPCFYPLLSAAFSSPPQHRRRQEQRHLCLSVCILSCLQQGLLEPRLRQAFLSFSIKTQRLHRRANRGHHLLPPTDPQRQEYISQQAFYAAWPNTNL